MGLSLALTTARSSIQANAAQIAVASRNVHAAVLEGLRVGMGVGR